MKMRKYFYSKKNIHFLPPKVQCHRGLWVSGIRENTLKAIQMSFEAGYEMCEFDVRMTKDQIPVLFHDDRLQGQMISELTYNELIQITDVDRLEDLFKWYISMRRELPPSNAQFSFSQKLKKFNFYLNIEIKSKEVFVRQLESHVLNLIEKYQLENSILISSFNPLTLFYFRIKNNLIMRALLLTYANEHGNNFFVKSQILNILAKPQFLHLNEKDWKLKKYIHLLNYKIPIILWTCNNLDASKKYFNQGVYGIISDSIRPSELI